MEKEGKKAFEIILKSCQREKTVINVNTILCISQEIQNMLFCAQIELHLPIAILKSAVFKIIILVLYSSVFQTRCNEFSLD